MLLLGEANELYQQGLQDLHRKMTERLGQLAAADLMTAAEAAGLPCDASQDRAEVILLLALAEWEMTPAAMAFIEMAEAAARRGACLIPEEWAGSCQRGRRRENGVPRAGPPTGTSAIIFFACRGGRRTADRRGRFCHDLAP
ncbi:hypothetical protein [Streptomyces sp. NBC_00019]|uniref:hypothetical protein n=1 Tax=Streptomyces sp. NBC_00019 TaxID=2975623 RepID=UPI0032539E26